MSFLSLFRIREISSTFTPQSTGVLFSGYRLFFGKKGMKIFTFLEENADK